MEKSIRKRRSKKWGLLQQELTINVGALESFQHLGTYFFPYVKLGGGCSRWAGRSFLGSIRPWTKMCPWEMKQGKRLIQICSVTYVWLTYCLIYPSALRGLQFSSTSWCSGISGDRGVWLSSIHNWIMTHLVTLQLGFVSAPLSHDMLLCALSQAKWCRQVWMSSIEQTPL